MNARAKGRFAPPFWITGLLSFSCLSLVTFQAISSEDEQGPQLGGGLDEIVVTATRREETLSKVPISVSAYTQSQLDVRGLDSVQDLFRETPGVTFTPSAFANESSINIRGISSTTGAPTTGIYIDDSPIQVRPTGIGLVTNFYPALVDLARVEVLRGPQGTLFGAGAEGGAVRFITREPDLQTSTAYVKSDIGYTEHGGVTNEVAASGSAPVIPGQLAISASASYRRDGGWVDIVEGNGQITQANANWNETRTARLAAKYVPSDWVTITPSLFYESTDKNNGDGYWPSISNPANGTYLEADRWPTSYRSNFSLPALKVDINVGAIHLASNTSFFDGVDHSGTDYSALVPGLLGLIARPVGTNIELSAPSGATVLPGYLNPIFTDSSHQFFTQEIRANSSALDNRLNWLGGIFYTSSSETAGPVLDVSGYLPGQWQQLLTTVGPATAQYFTAPLVDGKYSYDGSNRTHEHQVAAFADATWELATNWKVDVGLRYGRNTYSFFQTAAGPFAGGGASGGGDQSERPFTPKFALSYQVSDSNLVYLSAAKGFRTGGANYVLPSACVAEATELGLTNADRYKSDSLWSYELGSKSRLLDGRLSIDGSAYYVDWSDIQQNVDLNCGFNLTLNLGHARSKGFDLQFQYAATDALTLGADVAETDAYYSRTLYALGSTSQILVSNGDALPSTPWMFVGSAQYRFQVLQKQTYVRADYTYTSEAPRTPDLNSQNSPSVYNPYGVRIPGYGFLNLRAGVLLDSWNLSIYAKNATNGAALLAVNRYEIDGDFVNRNIGIRPLTAGVQAIFRY
jgi:iron complex outermembrane receptor protein